MRFLDFVITMNTFRWCCLSHMVKFVWQTGLLFILLRDLSRGYGFPTCPVFLHQPFQNGLVNHEGFLYKNDSLLTIRCDSEGSSVIKTGWLNVLNWCMFHLHTTGTTSYTDIWTPTIKVPERLKIFYLCMTVIDRLFWASFLYVVSSSVPHRRQSHDSIKNGRQTQFPCWAWWGFFGTI
jgi:hypothetical protein